MKIKSQVVVDSKSKLKEVFGILLFSLFLIPHSFFLSFLGHRYWYNRTNPQTILADTIKLKNIGRHTDNQYEIETALTLPLCAPTCVYSMNHHHSAPFLVYGLDATHLCEFRKSNFFRVGSGVWVQFFYSALQARGK